MATYRGQKQQPTRLNLAALQVASFAERRSVMLTQQFILGAVAFIVAFDLFLALNDIQGDTISEVIKGWAYRR